MSCGEASCTQGQILVGWHGRTAKTVTAGQMMIVRRVMKFAKYLLLLAGVALSLPLSAMAKDNGSNNSGKFTVAENVKVGSTELKPGNYKVEWDGSGDSVQVKIMQGKNTV